MRKWQESSTHLPTESLGEFAVQHPLAARLLVRRGISDSQVAHAFLDPDCYRPSSPFDLLGMKVGVERLAKSIRTGERIGVWGDFDVDGLTGAAILVGALRAAGADVLYHIPIRALASHGVHRPALEDLIHQGMRLLITCDTGVDAYDETAYAQSQGVDVIISDHHSLPRRLPAALSIINPHFTPPEHPFNTLPGAGVAYEIVEGLAQYGVPRILPVTYLDLAALAVVADVVPVLGEARWLLQRGLRALRTSHRPALRAMYARSEIDPTNLSEEHIAYLLAPRINAVGRLADAGSLVEFFITEDHDFIETMATKMEALNARRRLLSQEVFDSAIGMIAREPSMLETPVIVLSHPAWQAGVIGVVAGRLVQTYNRPVVLIASDSKTGIGRGSARSIPGVDIAAAIARQAQLLKTHGGHPAAAGFSLNSENIENFRRSLARTVAEMLSGQELEATLTIDGFLSLSELNLELAGEVELLAPFGSGNPGPIFASQNLNLLSATPIGRGQEHLKMRVVDGRGNNQDVLWWQGAGQPLPRESFDLAYSLRAVTDQGRRGMQLVWIDARPSETTPADIVDASRLPYDIIDLRTYDDPRLVFETALASQAADVQIWCEGESCPSSQSTTGACRQRYTLQGGEILVVWNAPPARDVLQAAIAAAKPRQIYLFSVIPKSPTPSEFLRQLAGYIKSALRTNEGRMSTISLASMMAQTEPVVHMGIEWLAAHGDITYTIPDPSVSNEIIVSLPKDKAIDQAGAARLLEHIKAALAESAAFREFYRRAELGALF
jgi:single-stranded-DNA-specific exonuclease